MKLGGYGVIRGYGIDPTIIQTTATSGIMTFDWAEYGSHVSYKAYYSAQGPDGPWVTYSGVTDSGVGRNRVTVTGLNPLTKYYVRVGATGTDGMECFGPVVAISTTASI
jgi:hypothetical protein